MPEPAIKDAVRRAIGSPNLNKFDVDTILSFIPEYFSYTLESGVDVHAKLAKQLGDDRETAKRKLFCFLYASKSIASMLWIKRDSKAFYLLAKDVAKEREAPIKEILDEYSKKAAVSLRMPENFH